MTTPAELKHVLESGLLSFPLTDFDSQLQFAPKPYAQRLEWLMPYGASALFAAGGTGEFFSLEPGEYARVIQLAVDTCRGRMPIIGAAGAGTALAIQYAQETERAGAQGLLLLPHYLTEASQEGLIAHVQAVCRSVKLGVIVYNRGAARYAPETVAKLAETCPNLIGYKDGVGDIEHFVSVRRKLGDRGSGLHDAHRVAVAAIAQRDVRQEELVDESVGGLAVAGGVRVVELDRGPRDEVEDGGRVHRAAHRLVCAGEYFRGR